MDMKPNYNDASTRTAALVVFSWWLVVFSVLTK